MGKLLNGPALEGEQQGKRGENRGSGRREEEKETKIGREEKG